MTVPVTGAGRGIGGALAIEALARGQSVIGTHRGATAALTGPEWQALEVTDPESHRALAARRGGCPLSALICNAGVLLDRGQRLGDGYSAAMWAESFAVNVTGVFLPIRALLPSPRAGLSAFGQARIMILSGQMASTTRAPGGSLICRAAKGARRHPGRHLPPRLGADEDGRHRR